MRCSRKQRRDLAAEHVCRSLRLDVQDHGRLSQSTLGYLLRWMSLTGKVKYEPPPKINKRWSR
jgi:hypothetical protein